MVYRALASTNLALPFSQWAPAATNISSSTGNFSITLTNAECQKNPWQKYKTPRPPFFERSGPLSFFCPHFSA
jgi:hypothetical protein